MTHPPGNGGPRAALLAALSQLPPGRVATYAALAEHLKIPERLVETMLAQMSEGERDLLAWHRVVANGGAIGWGPHREAKLSKLVREGVSVSRAGVVQDMARIALRDLSAQGLAAAAREAPASLIPSGSRSRGMKDRPGL
jgi:methylated-DNA-protein-cysteine methyltransferase-like protein